MALEDIRDKILREAQQKAREMVEEAQTEAKRILQTGEEEAKALREDLLSKAREEAQIRRNRIVGAKRLEIKKQRLASKRAAIDKAFEQALQQMLDLSPEEYQVFIKSLLRQVPINDNEALLITNERDRSRITRSLLDQLSREISSNRSKRIKLRLAPETRDIKGGIIVSCGKIEINYSLEVLLRFLKEEMEPDMARVLFEEREQ